jgi:hypothetical protein
MFRRIASAIAKIASSACHRHVLIIHMHGHVSVHTVIHVCKHADCGLKGHSHCEPHSAWHTRPDACRVARRSATAELLHGRSVARTLHAPEDERLERCCACGVELLGVAQRRLVRVASKPARVEGLDTHKDERRFGCNALDTPSVIWWCALDRDPYLATAGEAPPAGFFFFSCTRWLVCCSCAAQARWLAWHVLGEAMFCSMRPAAPV